MLGLSSGRVDLSWGAATDNVGVAGVQFKVDGVNQGAEDTVSPYTTTWNATNPSGMSVRTNRRRQSSSTAMDGMSSAAQVLASTTSFSLR